jgi:hypothetical protein
MIGPKVQMMQDILEEHFEELQFLWGQRQAAFESPAYTLRDLLELEERIEAHVQGLLGGGEQMITFVERSLSEDESLLVFAASYMLLRLNSQTAAQQVMNAFLQAEAGQLDGIRQAMCHGPITMIRDPLREAFAAAPTPIATVAAETLAFHRQLDPEAERLSKTRMRRSAGLHGGSLPCWIPPRTRHL